jgi:hypothetical protein
MATIDLRPKVLTVLTQRGESMSYRDLIDTLWSTFPDIHQHFLTLYIDEKRARKDLRIRLGMIVKNHPTVFTATLADGIVMVGLAATPVDELEDLDADDVDESEDESLADSAGKPGVYWYTFEAYRKDNGPYPIKIGRGKNPMARISQQVTAMPEPPKILGTHEHPDEISLERALHSVLALRGKRKKDAPGSEWFVTTPAEIEALIGMVLGE